VNIKNIPNIVGLQILLLEQEIWHNHMVELAYVVLFQYYGIGNVLSLDGVTV
jgi:hypothetical protein